MIQSERKRKRAAVYVDSRMLLLGANNEITVPVLCVGDGKYGAIERRHAVIVYVQEMWLVYMRQCRWTKWSKLQHTIRKLHNIVRKATR